MIFHKFHENRVYWIDPATYKSPTLTTGRNQDLQYRIKYFRPDRYHPLKTRCNGILYGGYIGR